MNRCKVASYWTQRRKIRGNVIQHINPIIGENYPLEEQDSDSTSETLEQQHDMNEGGNSDETIQIAPKSFVYEENFCPNSPLEVNDFHDIEGAEPYILFSDSESDTENRHDDGNIFASMGSNMFLPYWSCSLVTGSCQILHILVI